MRRSSAFAAPTRRQLLGRALAAGALGAVAGHGRPSVAAAPSDRKFLFVFCKGGWDPTWVFAPMFGVDGVDVDPTGSAATVGGLTFVEGEGRPSVRAFFEAHAQRTAFLNGFEVRSVTHERCRRLLLTGTTQAEADDWASLIAAADPRYLLPHVVVSGPVFTATTTASVLRVGETGQLGGLLDGSALKGAEPPRDPLPDGLAALVDARVAAREDGWAAGVGAGRPADFAAGLLRVREQLTTALGIDGLELGIDVNGVATSVATRALPAIECLARGYSRCATIAHLGQYSAGWDTHQDGDTQVAHYETLFQDLVTILDELGARPGTAGGATLLDETVVVVWSEMGRAPVLNATRGKDHWTFTSAMLVGPGVRGATVAGGYDDDLLGRPVDLATGEAAESGTWLSSAHLGATLLALAGLDPGELSPVDALITDS